MRASITTVQPSRSSERAPERRSKALDGIDWADALGVLEVRHRDDIDIGLFDGLADILVRDRDQQRHRAHGHAGTRPDAGATVIAKIVGPGAGLSISLDMTQVFLFYGTVQVGARASASTITPDIASSEAMMKRIPGRASVLTTKAASQAAKNISIVPMIATTVTVV